MAVKRLELSESEFLRRVDHRSRSRYDEPFPESLLADLHKDDLIPELERSGNEGLSPKYFATWRHYRRALQLQRLRSVGIKGRDALRVQLFVRGYGLKVFEVRDAVRRELLRGLSELRPPLRSQYFHSQRDPGPAHLAEADHLAVRGPGCPVFHQVVDAGQVGGHRTAPYPEPPTILHVVYSPDSGGAPSSPQQPVVRTEQIA